MTDPSKASDGSAPEIYSLAQIQHLVRVEFSRAQRYSYPIVCLVVAIDRLGTIRDQHGYESKEAVLETVIDLLHGETRGSDFLGRLPDDRLIVVVPHSSPEMIEIMARRLVEKAHSVRLPELRGEAISLTIGGSWMTCGETLFFDQLTQTAELCLDEATAAGGDRYLARAPEGLE